MNKIAIIIKIIENKEELAHIMMMEIAKDLKISRSTVNKELAALRDDLRNTLESEGYTL